jgi:hypothetical protein
VLFFLHDPITIGNIVPQIDFYQEIQVPSDASTGNKDLRPVAANATDIFVLMHGGQWAISTGRSAL